MRSSNAILSNQYYNGRKNQPAAAEADCSKDKGTEAQSRKTI
jgi:hypothetical protein